MSETPSDVERTFYLIQSFDARGCRFYPCVMLFQHGAEAKAYCKMHNERYVLHGYRKVYRGYYADSMKEFDAKDTE